MTAPDFVHGVQTRIAENDLARFILLAGTMSAMVLVSSSSLVTNKSAKIGDYRLCLRVIGGQFRESIDMAVNLGDSEIEGLNVLLVPRCRASPAVQFPRL